MTIYFVSRHPGALAWSAQQHLAIDRVVPHLEVSHVRQGDTVIGTLPVHLAAQVCAAGAAYWHLTLALPVELRGHDISAQVMEQLGARLQRFEVCTASEPRMDAP